ncbi:hypothetical protein ACQ27_gp481 [Klebsiella phage K64-1]|nr:hypothetical protein ACQ27_gp481 [Klebsiella phage K64-1]
MLSLIPLYLVKYIITVRNYFIQYKVLV